MLTQCFEALKFSKNNMKIRSRDDISSWIYWWIYWSTDLLIYMDLLVIYWCHKFHENNLLFLHLFVQ